MPESSNVQPAEQQRESSGPLRTAVIVNPVRVEGLDALRAEIVERLTAAGWPEPAWFETTAEDPGTGQARRAVEEGAEVVFVAGGDGTVRACVAGLAGTRTALAILPGGTGNLLATNLGVPTQSVEGIRLAMERGRREIDLGESDGGVFAVMAGMGLDAAMMQDAPTALKARAGWVAYLVGAVKHLADPEMKVEVHVDDQPVRRRRARTVVVGNVGRLPAGTNLLPDADPDDGLLEVAIIAPRGVRHWVQLVVGLFRGDRRVPSREVVRGRRISVVSDRPQSRQLDGDVIDRARRLDVEVRPKALWVCVEQPDESEDLAAGSPERG
ncbi:diacylglycerol kinase family protein [Cellulosimicrobium sp. CUA-896]|uniref:diacylglycerol/lipid kinase family protein n=1 Tax=Cellulosimicrobium sp. CUA-896 TaxID=1517881 RepID=UPI00095984BE|nr:diacylglycerol kinase family protein [Cellulosimicrobium sp. CUA-896]OLT50918.1 diacylglycerol kinase [Cellulosimicrobium sp. CUA-896]